MESNGSENVSPSSSHTDMHLARQALIKSWKREQYQLRSQLIVHDSCLWNIPRSRTQSYFQNPNHELSTASLINSTQCSSEEARHETSPKESLTSFRDVLISSCTQNGQRTKSSLEEELKLIGGVDLSFSTHDPNVACAALVVLDSTSFKVVYEDYQLVHMSQPYKAGYLAFRECPPLLKLLEKLDSSQPHLKPQVILVDGNGILHYRGFGLACHLGVMAGVPTIGVAKNMIDVDGMTAQTVKRSMAKIYGTSEKVLPLVGKSGRTWGAAVLTSDGAKNPVFVSIGHRVSLNTAIHIVQHCSVFRIPEPVRQADLRSREYLRKQTTWAVPHVG